MKSSDSLHVLHWSRLFTQYWRCLTEASPIFHRGTLSQGGWGLWRFDPEMNRFTSWGLNIRHAGQFSNCQPQPFHKQEQACKKGPHCPPGEKHQTLQNRNKQEEFCTNACPYKIQFSGVFSHTSVISNNNLPNSY